MATRTLGALMERIAFRQDRMETNLMLLDLSKEHVQKYIAFEQQIINNLKGQVNNRVNWYMRCCGITPC